MPLLTEEIDQKLGELLEQSQKAEIIYLTDTGRERLLSEITPQGLTMQVTHYKGVPVQMVRGETPDFFVTGRKPRDAA